MEFSAGLSDFVLAIEYAAALCFAMDVGEYVPGPGPWSTEPMPCSLDLEGVPIECAGEVCFATNVVVYDPGPGVMLS